MTKKQYTIEHDKNITSKNLSFDNTSICPLFDNTSIILAFDASVTDPPLFSGYGAIELLWHDFDQWGPSF